MHPLHRLMQGVFCVCRRNQLAGGCLICFGFGMLLASCIESVFFCCCMGVILAGGGFLVLVKK